MKNNEHIIDRRGHKICKAIILAILLPFSSIFASSQEYGKFEHFSTSDGLISDRIYSIACDTNGFLWLATDYGFDRFDGKEFKHHLKADYPALSREDVLISFVGDDNNVYLGGYYGLLAEYDQEGDSIINQMPPIYKTTKYEETEGFYKSEDGRTFALTTGGIFPYDPATKTFTSDAAIYQNTKDTYIKSMYIDKFGRYWVGSLDKYYVYDKEGKLIVACDPPADGCGFISNILPINDHQILVTAQTREMWIFDITDTIGKPTIFHAPFGNTIKILKDKNDRYWFATDGFGLWYTDEEITPNVKFHNIVPYNSQGTEIRKIYSMSTDLEGNLWFGTRNSGIWCYRGNEMTSIAFSKNYGFPKVACTAIAEDKKGNLIICSDGCGIYYISPDFKKMELVELENNNVCSVVVKENGDLVVPTWGGGIFNVVGDNKNVTHENLTGIHQASRCYFGVNKFGDNLYACSAGDGLYHKKGEEPWKKITLQNDTIEPDKWIFKAIEEKDGTVWVLTTTALWRIRNEKSKLITRGDNFPQANATITILDGICDSDGNFIAATDKGIVQVPSGKDTFELLDYIPSYSYHSIINDDNGHLWASGNNGIAEINTRDKSCRLLTDSRNDISLHNFIYRSGFKDSQGKIHFGTDDGFVSLDPAHLSIDSVIPYLSFSDLYIGSEKINRGQGPLNAHNLGEGTLTLEHGQTDITILYDAIDYTEFDPLQYKYKLSGLKEEWTPVKGPKSIHFSHIPAGHYQLVVEAFRNNKDCAPKQITVDIVVLPPWWESLWFRIVMSIIITLIVGSLILLRIKRLMNAKNELEQRVNERTSELKEALNDKDRLISVVAHDLKNPMFAIVGALENLTRKGSQLDEQERKRIEESTYDSAKTLQNEMLKILDWAQSKKEDITCHPTDVDIQSTVQNVTLLLRNVMEKKQINLTTDIHLTHLAFVDSRMMEAVIRNLLSNAIKFTPAEGTISILSWMDNKNIKIAVKDTGVGMNEEQLATLKAGKSTKSTQGTESESGNGLGYGICRNYILRNNGTIDMESKLGEGTTVTITLPSSERKIEIKEEYRIQGAKSAEDYTILTGNTALIVDDNPLICDNLKTLLSAHLNVLTANNGKEALKIAEEQLPDIILSDVEMPIMNGIEMSRIIEQTDAVSHIPLLFLSARNEDSDRLLGLKSGAVDYIPKPFSPEELLLKVCNILMMRQKQQQFLLSKMMEKKSESGEAEVGDEQTNGEATGTQKVNPFVKQMLEVIEKRFTESTLTVEDIAQDMCLSKSTLTRRTNSIIGKTPLEILNEYRLNEAMRSLKEADSETQISDIAYNVGFSDPAYFSRRFREHFGLKPSQIIKKS